MKEQYTKDCNVRVKVMLFPLIRSAVMFELSKESLLKMENIEMASKQVNQCCVLAYGLHNFPVLNKVRLVASYINVLTNSRTHYTYVSFKCFVSTSSHVMM